MVIGLFGLLTYGPLTGMCSDDIYQSSKTNTVNKSNQHNKKKKRRKNKKNKRKR